MQYLEWLINIVTIIVLILAIKRLVRKSGKMWLVTRQGMERLYGKETDRPI